MASRERMELQQVLQGILGPDVHVYHQAPTKLIYPCVIYHRSKIDNDYANNKVYGNKKQYTLTLIYREPDSNLPDILANLPTSKHGSYFVSENLHHDVFTIFF